MKPLLIFSLLTCLFVYTSGCRKDKHEQKKYPDPMWTAPTSAQYPYTMTAVVSLPAYLQNDAGADDKMAAFVGTECRGVGVAIKKDSSAAVFYILIRGSAAEQSQVSFRYYNTKKSYLYATDALLTYAVDGNYGTVDEPAMPDFKEVN